MNIINMVTKKASNGAGKVLYLHTISASDRELVNRFIEGVNGFVAGRSPSGKRVLIASNSHKITIPEAK